VSCLLLPLFPTQSVSYCSSRYTKVVAEYRDPQDDETGDDDDETEGAGKEKSLPAPRRAPRA
jgi:hypothetical protein